MSWQMTEPFAFSDARHVVTLGRGKNGTLIQGYLSQRDQKIYAIKSVSWTHEKYCSLVKNIQREAATLQHICRNDTERDSLPNNISLYRCYIINYFGLVENPSISVPNSVNPKPIYICLEACLGGNLFQHLHHNVDPSFHLSLLQCRVYVTQLVNVLLYLFSIGVIHRDVKLSNIMINSFGHIKLTDFDSSKVFDSNDRFQRTLTLIGTFHLCAPEMLVFAVQQSSESEFTGYSYSIDWWSLGHLVYELLMKDFLPLRWQSHVERGVDGKVSSGTMTAEYCQRLLKLIKDGYQDNPPHGLKEDWSYYQSYRIRDLIDKIEDRKAKGARDFTSFTLLPYEFDENAPQILAHADDLVKRLLSINPTDRVFFSSISDRMSIAEGSNLRGKNHRILSEESLQSELQHPFLVKELLYPNDIREISSPQEYLLRLVESYSFPVNEKIGFYEMFPNQNEFKQSHGVITTQEKSNLDEITDEQQELFKDF